MSGIFAFAFSPIGRWVIGSLSILVLVGGIYTKGRLDGRASYKAKIERQINEAISEGNAGRADALKRLDAGSVSDGWFRD
jgi:hypothetical protein